MNIIKDSIRKVYNRPAYKVCVSVIKGINEYNAKRSVKNHDIQVIVFGTRKQAVAKRAMILRNLTQSAEIVNF